MANIKLHRWLIGIFTSIIVIFAMSHNASAVDLTYNLNDYSLVRSLPVDVIACGFSGGSNYVSGTGGRCSFKLGNTTNRLENIFTNNSYYAAIGDLIEFYLVVTADGPISDGSGSLGNLINFNSNFYILNVDKVVGNQLYSFLDLYNGWIGSEQSQGRTLDFDLLNKYYSYDVYKFVLVSKNSGTFQFGLNNTPLIFKPVSSNPPTVTFQLFHINQFRFKGSEENREQEQATQDAVDDSQDAGDSSSSSAQSGSASLLNVIGAFAGIITSAQPTNCLINGNMGNLNIGQIDLCANPVPSFVQIIGSIILVCLVIPFVVIMFNRFISIFRSFQS